MTDIELSRFDTASPTCQLFNQLMDKWSMMALATLNAGPLRFNAIKRSLSGVSQKALTQSLRRLQRNGLIYRRVIPVQPPGVEYEITPLGRSLQPPFLALYAWTTTNLSAVEQARLVFDKDVEGERAPGLDVGGRQHAVSTDVFGLRPDISAGTGEKTDTYPSRPLEPK